MKRTEPDDRRLKVGVKWEEGSAKSARVMAEGECIERLGTGFTFTEGPVWHPGGYLLFSDIPENRIWKWHPGKGFSVFKEPSGNSNGLALDRNNNLIACEHGNRRVTLTREDGSESVLADRFNGKRLNSPNDAAASSGGEVYFTDPPYGIKEGEKELSFNGVFKLDSEGRLGVLADDFDMPNGLAFSPPGTTLYVADSRRKHIRGFKLDSGLELSGGGFPCSMDCDEEGVPDGMKVDCEGNIFATGGGGCGSSARRWKSWDGF